jgi:uncharacterized protein (TIGR03067 family)
MKPALLVALLSCSSVVLPAQRDPRAALDRVQGNWVVTAASGEEIPAGAHVALVITGDTFQSVKNGKVDQRGTLKLDASRTPMWVDFAITDGPYAGKLQLGLAELSCDTLTLTLAEPGAPVRPLATTPEKVTSTRLKPIARQFEGTFTQGRGPRPLVLKRPK